MIPTIEEVKRVAEECGFDFRRCEAGELATGYASELQAFAQYWIEVGRKEQRESDAKLLDNLTRTISNMLAANADTIRNNTGE